MFKDTMRANCLQGMQKLIMACKEWDLLKNPTSQHDLVLQATELSEDVANAVQELWKSKHIQLAFERNNELQLPGGTSGMTYYIKHALRFAARDYLPTEDDVIQANQSTNSGGIKEIVFTIGNTEFTLIEVRGHFDRKWLPCFVDVFAVIFLVAMDEYDMVMEDNKTNRMEESLKLFQKVSGSIWLEETPFILCLNKSDLLKEKILKSPVRDYFEDYDQFINGLENGTKMNEYLQSCEYIKAQYIEAFNGSRLYPYVTCAFETEICDNVLSAVRDIWTYF